MFFSSNSKIRQRSVQQEGLPLLIDQVNGTLDHSRHATLKKAGVSTRVLGKVFPEVIRVDTQGTGSPFLHQTNKGL